jgi:exodeoxyribonuclease VII large subunit
MRLQDFRHRTQIASDQLIRLVEKRLTEARWQHRSLQDKLRLLSPLNIMERGYSIVRSKRTSKIIKKASEVQMGDELLIELHKGKITARV